LNISDLQLERLSSTADSPASSPSEQKISPDVSLHQWMREQEKVYLIRKLKSFGGRIDLTAKSCGVDVRTLHRKMQIYGLDKKIFTKAASPMRPQTSAMRS
jgi:DNA-binding NtrC family response regulator